MTRDIDVTGGTIRLAEWGDPAAPAVLWLHGAGGGNTGPLTWSATAQALAGFRHLVPDVLGFGHSPATEPRPHGLAAWHIARVRALIETLDALGVESAAVVGHSMGGMYAVSLLAEHARRFPKGVLVASGGTPVRMGPQIKAMITYYANPGPEQMATNLRGDVGDPRCLDGILDELVAERVALAEAAGIREAHESTFARDAPGLVFSAADIAAVAQPVLLVHGDSDQVIPAAASEFLAEHLPHGRLEVRPRLGHWPMWEDPQWFRTLVGEFLTA